MGLLLLVSFSVAAFFADIPKILSESIWEENDTEVIQSLLITDNTNVDSFSLMQEESLGE